MKTNKLAFLFTCLSSLLLLTYAEDEECKIDKESPSAVSLFIGSHRNSTGDWTTSFSVNKGDSDLEGNNNLTLKLSQDVAECKGKKILQIRGVLSGLSSSVTKENLSIKKKELFFHHKCGSNVAVLNNGLQARKINNKSWAWYISNSYLNGAVHLKNYGKSLDAMNVGDRAAVKRTNTGALHFYYNGVDQGPAFSNIPHPVYGVVELYGNAAMVSIVED